MNNEARNCLACNKTVRGRSDKKFCDDNCRNGYNYRKKEEERPYIKFVNGILYRNRKVLEMLFTKETTVVKVSRQVLLQNGFCFDCITSLYTNSRGKTYQYCYEYGLLPLEKDLFLLVKKKEERVI